MQTQLSIIYKTGIALPLACITLTSCDPGTGGETPRYTYEVAIKNQSASPVSIYGYNTADPYGTKLEMAELKYSLLVGAASLSSISTVTIPKPLGDPAFGFMYPGFEDVVVDSIVLKFSDSRGYYSNLNGNTVWLSGKSTLWNVKENDIVQQDGVLIYPITQQDYENAHVLP
ncbi:hypothetical protein EB1_25270 [Empedobacter brevis NBRC 14943 = ATCC 43319]|uniref:Uncharacterized protein n=1 Tax=Empedobacter brevis NBRC 14943 = ATCC 43319 TaxID=1218108 RepID=A0A511NJ69_9FLAO|nr:hypothetical protein [Empedobacter brevis]GEM52737.1 hypothetical protein EB1_25270 [Empedobacter brevis NBRC 14943 = ATCC 43319]